MPIDFGNAVKGAKRLGLERSIADAANVSDGLMRRRSLCSLLENISTPLFYEVSIPLENLSVLVVSGPEKGAA